MKKNKILLLSIDFYNDPKPSYRMKFPVRTIFKFLLLLLLSQQVSAQADGSLAATEFEQLYKAIEKEYRFDPELVNGIYYENPYLRALGHPFLDEDKFYKGSLVYREKKYDNLELKYDVFSQNLILKYLNQGSQVQVILPEEFISEFFIAGRLFRKYSHPEKEPAFYQVISDKKKIGCRYFWFKERDESDHSGTYFSYRFNNDQKHCFLVINNQVLRYKNNRSFIKLFPEEFRKGIKQEIKSKMIKVNESEDHEIVELIDFCEGLLYPDNTTMAQRYSSKK